MSDDLQITVINDPAIDVVTLDDEVHVVDEVRDIQVVTVGEVGPPGPAGPAGAGSGGGTQANFAYGDATPAAVVTAAAGKVVYSVEVVIVVPFDGVGAAITVGDAAVPDRLMNAGENALTLVGSNTTAPAYRYNVDTPVLLSITPGAGASQGSGAIIIHVQS
jgi:hypothetical protein